MTTYHGTTQGTVDYILHEPLRMAAVALRVLGLGLGLGLGVESGFGLGLGLGLDCRRSVRYAHTLTLN